METRDDYRVYTNPKFNTFDAAFDLMVKLGTADLNNPSDGMIERRIKEFKIHGKYEGKNYFDVALILMEESVEFTRFVRPVCLPTVPVDDQNHLSGQLVYSRDVLHKQTQFWVSLKCP